MGSTAIMVIVDTHIVIWAALTPKQLSNRAKKAINNADRVVICEISLWEIAMLVKKKRIEIPVSYLEFIDLIMASFNYELRGMNAEIANLSVNLPVEINSDPADRIICATSIITSFPLITADKKLQDSSLVSTIW